MNGIESVHTNSQRDGAFEVKTVKNGQTYFVLKATNGQVVGQSEQYKTPSGCQTGIESVKENAPDVKISEA